MDAKKKAELIREKISESDNPFQEIAMDFDFNCKLISLLTVRDYLE